MNRRHLRIAAWISFATAGLVLAVAVASLWFCFFADRYSLCCGVFGAYLAVEPGVPSWGAFRADSLGPFEERMVSFISVPDYTFAAGQLMSFNLPLWLPAALLILLGAVLRFLGSRANPGYCSKCGYDLTGNASGRCPECGTPADQTTYAENRE